jgi:hypothetical protein
MDGFQREVKAIALPQRHGDTETGTEGQRDRAIER